MSAENSSRQIFLQELYNRAEGDFEKEVSMYDMGTDLGLEKDDAAARRKDELDYKKGVPFVIINGNPIHGYSETAYAAAIKKSKI